MNDKLGNFTGNLLSVMCWLAILNQFYRKLIVVLLVGHNPEANEPDETFPETDDRIKPPSEVSCEQKIKQKDEIPNDKQVGHTDFNMYLFYDVIGCYISSHNRLV